MRQNPQTVHEYVGTTDAVQTNETPVQDHVAGDPDDVTRAARRRMMSVIIPAYNESAYLPKTVPALRRAASRVFRDCDVEIIVVNDGSTDDTATVAVQLADAVAEGSRRGIGQARNVGARHARGDVLVFVDADTVVEETVLSAIYESWRSGVRAGAVAAVYESHSWPVKALFRLWKWYATRKDMTQGVCQFFDRILFEELKGYRPDLFMAEDTDLYHRARKVLQKRGQGSCCEVLTHVTVYPSLRRYEQWRSWRILLWTNPWTTKLARGSRSFWRHWYENPPR